MHELKRGDKVKLKGAPDWLLRDLPADEKVRIDGFVGSITEIIDIDAFGYFWVKFGCFADDGSCFGHEFCVTREFLQKVE